MSLVKTMVLQDEQKRKDDPKYEGKFSYSISEKNELVFEHMKYFKRDGTVYFKQNEEESIATIETLHPIFEACRETDYFLKNFIYDFPTETLAKVDSSGCQVAINFPNVAVKVSLGKLLEHSQMFVELYQDCLKSVKGDEISVDVGIDCSKEVAEAVKNLIDDGSSWNLKVGDFIFGVEDAV